MRTLLVLSFLSFLLVSCNNDQETSFTLNTESSITVPGALVPFTDFETISSVFETEITQQLEENNMLREEITSATPSSVTVSLSNETFELVHNIQVFLQHPNGNEVALTGIHELSETNKGSTTFDVPIQDNNLDLLSYLTEERLTFRCIIQLNGFSPSDKTININSGFEITGTRS